MKCSECKKDIQELTLKNPVIAGLMSTIIPGSGRMYTGSIKRSEPGKIEKKANEDTLIVPVKLGPTVVPVFTPAPEGTDAFILLFLAVAFVPAIISLYYDSTVVFVSRALLWGYCVYDSFTTATKINMLYSISNHRCP